MTELLVSDRPYLVFWGQYLGAWFQFIQTPRHRLVTFVFVSGFFNMAFLCLFATSVVGGLQLRFVQVDQSLMNCSYKSQQESARGDQIIRTVPHVETPLDRSHRCVQVIGSVRRVKQKKHAFECAAGGFYRQPLNSGTWLQFSTVVQHIGDLHIRHRNAAGGCHG